ncbi:hypothetical protein CC86DRAFT_419032 [Ophiobolus disseminans]|uniref:Uncharacterized protein n=1 Tax=Ophiobolus disseminans TaxID=1469910 RepID=A0A6A6ZVV7_9PLEO|nr:hypothetical protein CC86DRAFT_419032 [Ophiobolus disseminans]
MGNSSSSHGGHRHQQASCYPGATRGHQQHEASRGYTQRERPRGHIQGHTQAHTQLERPRAYTQTQTYQPATQRDRPRAYPQTQTYQPSTRHPAATYTEYPDRSGAVSPLGTSYFEQPWQRPKCPRKQQQPFAVPGGYYGDFPTAERTGSTRTGGTSSTRTAGSSNQYGMGANFASGRVGGWGNCNETSNGTNLTINSQYPRAISSLAPPFLKLTDATQYLQHTTDLQAGIHTMSDLDDMITSRKNTTFDPESLTMQQLTSRLARSNIQDNVRSQAARAAYHYALNLSHIPCTFKPLSFADYADPQVQAVLAKYNHWLMAEDTDLLFEQLPPAPWALSIVSRAMVGIIVARAEKGVARMPAGSPQDHPRSPFWVEEGKYDGIFGDIGREGDGGCRKGEISENGDLEMT